MVLVILVPKLSVALKRRVEVENFVDGGESGQRVWGVEKSFKGKGVGYKKVV